MQHVHPVNKHLQSFLRSWTHEEISVQKSAITSLHVGNIPESIRISSSIDSEALPPESSACRGSRRRFATLRAWIPKECFIDEKVRFNGVREHGFGVQIISGAHKPIVKPDASGTSLMFKQAYPIEAFVPVLQTSAPRLFSQKVLLCIEKDRGISLVKPVEEQTR